MVTVRFVSQVGTGCNRKSFLVIVLLGEPTCSYNTLSCVDWCSGLKMHSHFLLTQTTYVIINVITAVVVTDTINVTMHVTAATAPVDKESDSDPSDPTCVHMN